MITNKTASFLLDIVNDRIEDAEVYVDGDDDEDGTYADLLVELKQAEKELLDILGN
jgi:hypothetical protein